MQLIDPKKGGTCIDCKFVRFSECNEDSSKMTLVCLARKNSSGAPSYVKAMNKRHGEILVRVKCEKFEINRG